MPLRTCQKGRTKRKKRNLVSILIDNYLKLQLFLIFNFLYPFNDLLKLQFVFIQRHVRYIRVLHLCSILTYTPCPLAIQSHFNYQFITFHPFLSPLLRQLYIYREHPSSRSNNLKTKSHKHTTMHRPISALFLPILVAGVLLPHVAATWWSASCISRSAKCSRWLSDRTEGCKPFTAAYMQPLQCKTSACTFCAGLKKPKPNSPCTIALLKQLCASFKSTTPQAPPKPPMNKGNCVWAANNRDEVVIDPTFVSSLPSQWTKTSRAGRAGIVYKAGGSTTRDTPGMASKSAICYRVRMRSSGDYYFTTISYAAGKEVHNDAFFRSASTGILFFRPPGDWHMHSWGNNGWFFGEQYSGGMSDDLFHSRDSDPAPNRFHIPDVTAGTTFRFCIAGRSPRFEIYRLVFVKCKTNTNPALNTCKGGKVGVWNLPTTACV